MIALLEAHRAGLLARQHLMKNVLAGLVVGVVALPLAMAFAIASGAKPEHGLYTAIVAGIVVSVFGGSRLQIAGPTGAFVVILSGITAKHGLDGLQLATLMAGVMLVGLGVARLGGVIKFIPDPVIKGFTFGIGVIIFVGQWAAFAGVTPGPGGEFFHQKLLALVAALPQAHGPTVALGSATLAVLLLWPKLKTRIPAPLVAMVFATVVQSVGHWSGVATIGSAFGGIPQQLPTLGLPEVSFERFLVLLGPAFAICLLGAIESLLSAMVADSMAGTRHDSNQELVGQGVANILTPLFGGFAATGAIARTATNVRNGATSPLAGVVHALTLLAVMLVCAPLAANIPLTALAAILFVVAWNMSEAPHVWHMLRTAPRGDAAVLLVTLVLTVFSDLVVAVNAGVVLAALLFMRRMAQAVKIEQVEGVPSAAIEPAREGTVVFSIDGPFFFGVAERVARTLENIHGQAQTLVLNLSRVPFIDATGLAALKDLADTCQRSGTRLVLAELQPVVAQKLARAGVLAKLGEGGVMGDPAQGVKHNGLSHEPKKDARQDNRRA